MAAVRAQHSPWAHVSGLHARSRVRVNGFLTPHKDAAALAGRLLELLDSPADCVRPGQAAQQTVRDGFTPESFAAALGLQDAVVFHGWLHQDQVRSFYERADLFV